MSGATGAKLACLRQGQDKNTTSAPWGAASATIALQCCEENAPGALDTCRRYIGSDSAQGCVGGKRPNMKEFTYEKAVKECARLGITHNNGKPYILCNHECDKQGCLYNEFPVYTRLPCKNVTRLL